MKNGTVDFERAHNEWSYVNMVIFERAYKGVMGDGSSVGRKITVIIESDNDDDHSPAANGVVDEIDGVDYEIEMDAVENEMDAVGNEIDGVDNEIDGVDNEIDAGDNESGAVENEIDAVDNEIDAGDNEIDAVDNEIDAGDNEIGAVENEIDAVDNEMDAGDNEIDAVDNEIVAVDNEKLYMGKQFGSSGWYCAKRASVKKCGERPKTKEKLVPLQFFGYKNP